MVDVDVTGGITLGTKLKMPIFTLTYPIIYKVEFCYFQSLSNWDTVSDRTYQNFRDKRMVRPGSKCPNWQRSQPISYKAKFSQRYIPSRSSGGKLRSDQFLYHEMPKMAESYLTTYMDELSTKLRSLF